MSFPSNEPFKPASSIPNPYGEGTAYKPAPGYGGPYGAPGVEPPARKGSGCLVAGIVGSILGLMGLLCAGCFGFGYFVLEAEHKETARQISVDYRNDPKIKEEVGEIEEITYNWGATLAREEDDYDVYDVRGDKGSAQLVVEASGTDVYSVLLQNSKGEWELPSDVEEIADDL